jgi:hypothetical protein
MRLKERADSEVSGSTKKTKRRLTDSTAAEKRNGR